MLSFRRFQQKSEAKPNMNSREAAYRVNSFGEGMTEGGRTTQVDSYQNKSNHQKSSVFHQKYLIQT